MRRYRRDRRVDRPGPGRDGDAFRELVKPYERELHLHCYRILGSVQGTEDVMHDALLAAWQG
jgi:DNA-directed RNA polymerase specialized sigma24 family protein